MKKDDLLKTWGIANLHYRKMTLDESVVLMQKYRRMTLPKLQEFVQKDIEKMKRVYGTDETISCAQKAAINFDASMFANDPNQWLSFMFGVVSTSHALESLTSEQKDSACFELYCLSLEAGLI